MMLEAERGGVTILLKITVHDEDNISDVQIHINVRKNNFIKG